MRRLQSFSNWFFSLFHKRELDASLTNEVRFHVERQIQQNISSGMSPAEASRSALRDFGGLEKFSEECRDARRTNFLENLLQDVRFGARMLRKNPGFTAVGILTLALGFGANIAVFGMVNALLLHPYNFPKLDSIVRVWESRGGEEGYDERWIAPADAADLLSNTGIFENLATYRDKSFNLATAGSVEPVLGCLVSPSFFEVLQVSPALGRGFAETEERPGLDQVVILSHALWQRQFGGDPTILGTAIRLNGHPRTVIGIMPPKFSFPVPALLWVPLPRDPAQQLDRSQLSVMALGRLQPGVSSSQANAALAGFAHRLEQEYPKTNTGRSAIALQLRKELYLYTLPLFLLLEAAAGFVLLLACANLANLLFARMVARQKEIAMRTALGAGNRRLAQLFLSETILLALLSAVVAVTISFWSVRLIRTSISEEWTRWVPGWDGIQVDRTVLGFAILLMVAVGLLFGLAALLHTRGFHLSTMLREAGTGSFTVAKARLRSSLVVTQVILALLLLVCAGLIMQGFARLSDVYAGLQPAHVLRVEIALPDQDYATDTKTINFFQRFLRSAAAMPGVTQAALVTNLPASNVDDETTLFTVAGRPPNKDAPSANLQIVSPNYFPALRIPLLAGRRFSEADTADVQPVALVSRSMAQQFWPNEDVIGKGFKLGDSDSTAPWLKIVGVVADVRQNWWNPPTSPTIYRPFLQAPQRSMTFILRAGSNPTGYISGLREVVRRLDPEVSPRGINTLEFEVSDSIGVIRIMGVLMAVFGCVALLLSSIGVYGVLSESVAQRTREIGIRLALGATPGDLMKLVLAQALRLTVIGLAIALPISYAVGHLMASLVFGIVRTDLAVVAAFAFLLLLLSLVAAYVPARRALRVDPMRALRYE
jgi:putative ABC transport system permease protein